ncbi:MAG: KamA family radical SAM protein [Chitinispirillaceae bacterium]|nr:KamA family radical SAM protein [Chitinispirillaceae bacterium]
MHQIFPPMKTRAIDSVTELLAHLDLDQNNAPYAILSRPGYPILVPHSYVQRMRKNDWFDPLLLQILPRSEEDIKKPEFQKDAVGDAAALVAPGVLHKYATRVLLLVSSVCAMHCRFCFRRGYPFAKPPATVKEWLPAWQYIEDHGTVDEIILSGGDPFCLEFDYLDELLRRTAEIPHVRIVRIHTRVPVADPVRVSNAVFEALARVAAVKTCIVVIHANHAAELAGKSVSCCLSRLRATGAIILNQSVLLADVNDTVVSQQELLKRLVDNKVMPYYLHQLDRVDGAWHFEVEEGRGRAIINHLRINLPGYAVPRYVREKSGEKSKTPL